MSAKRRSGYTLFEVSLVMAVIVIVGAFSVPVLKSMLTSNHLQAASDMVRSRWAEMRTRALSDGRSYRFSIVENTGKFRIAPEDEESHSDAPPWIVESTLPGGVVFNSTEATPAGGAPGQASGGGSSGGWTKVVSFLANGTSHEDVQVGFSQPGGGRPITLRLRGATGAVTAHEGPTS